jgi:hypothetical protein
VTGLGDTMQSGARTVPIGTLGGRQVPRLILGDNGFLRKYGSTLALAEIRALMRLASAVGAGLAAGDERCLRAAREAAADDGFVLAHIDARFRSGDRGAHFGRCMATLADALARDAPDFLDTDPIMGAFVGGYRRFRPYAWEDVLRLDSQSIGSDARRMRLYRPEAISVGGDYLDALLAIGRHDLVLDALAVWREACDDIDALLVFTTYLAGYVEPRVLRRVAEPATAILVPYNAAGFGMLPTRLAVQRAVSEARRPVIAMHVLGSGRLRPAEALAAVLADEYVATAVVGASTPKHIAELLAAARPSDGAQPVSIHEVQP